MSKITLRDLYEGLNRLEEKFDKTFVTKDEFNPVRNIVYGLVSLILAAVVVAIVGLVIIPG